MVPYIDDDDLPDYGDCDWDWEPEPPIVDECRRCGRIAELNDNDYCSAGCEMGYKPGEFWR